MGWGVGERGGWVEDGEGEGVVEGAEWGWGEGTEIDVTLIHNIHDIFSLAPVIQGANISFLRSEKDSTFSNFISCL